MARMSETHVAVVDDKPAITQLIADYLKSHGFRVSQLRGGNSLFALMATDPPALVLLDIGLGGEDGLAVARKLRAHWRCGLVIVTGRGDIVDRIVGLEVGADDYVAKPFDLRELVARIKAVLRRLQPDEADGLAPETECACFSFARWSLDVGARRLTAPDTTEVLLTSGERARHHRSAADQRRVRIVARVCRASRPRPLARIPPRVHTRPRSRPL